MIEYTACTPIIAKCPNSTVQGACHMAVACSRVEDRDRLAICLFPKHISLGGEGQHIVVLATSWGVGCHFVLQPLLDLFVKDVQLTISKYSWSSPRIKPLWYFKIYHHFGHGAVTGRRYVVAVGRGFLNESEKIVFFLVLNCL